MTIIKLDKERELKYTFSTLVRMEKAFKKPISDIFQDLGYMETALKVFYHGLKHEDSKLTVENVEKLADDYVDTNGLTGFMTLLSGEIEKTMGVAKSLPSNK